MSNDQSTNGPEGVFSNSGGVSRYQVSSSEPSQEAASGGMRSTASFTGGVLRSTTTTNREGVQTTTHSNAPSISRGSSGDATPSAGPVFKSTAGRVLMPNEITGASVVTVGGMTTNVRAAIATGLLRVGPNGYESADGVAAGAPQSPSKELDEALANERALADQAENDAAPQVAVFDEATEALLDETMPLLGNMDRQAALRSVMETGDLTPDLVARLSNQIGQEPSVTSERAKTIIAAFDKQAREAVGFASSETIFEWARNKSPAALKQAMHDHGTAGTVQGYKAIASDYYASLADTKAGRDEILNCGDAAARGIFVKNGTLMITLPTVGPVTWRAACRGGFISPRRG